MIIVITIITRDLKLSRYIGVSMNLHVFVMASVKEGERERRNSTRFSEHIPRNL